MSGLTQSLVVAIQGLESNLDDQEIVNTTCKVFLNNKEVSVFDISSFSFSSLVSNVSPTDIIQIILIKQDEEEFIGSVSFLAETFLKNNSSKFVQWITLFSDPDDDLFDGDIGIDDIDIPRALVSFTRSDDSANFVMNKSGMNIQAPELLFPEKELSDNQMSENYALDKESDIANFRISTEYGADERPESLKCGIDIISNRDGEKKQSPLEKKSIDLDCSKERENHYQLDFQDLAKTNYKSKDNLQHQQRTLDSADHIPPKVHVNSDFDKINSNPWISNTYDFSGRNLKRNFGKELAILSDKLQQASDLVKNAKELKEILVGREYLDLDAETKYNDQVSNYYREEINILRSKNEELGTRVQRVLNESENLKKENQLLRKSENTYANMFNKMKTELEETTLKAGVYEKLVSELQEQIVSLQEQIKEEIHSKLNISIEKEKISETLHRLEEKHERLKKNNTNAGKLLLNPIGRVDKEVQTANQKDENNQNKEKSLNTKSQDESCQTENDDLKEKLNEFEKQSEEDKRIICELKAKIEVLEKQSNRSKDDHELESKAQKMNSEAFKTSNNFQVDQLLVASLLSQIGDLKSHIASLETENRSLKDELFKSNDNYAKLTTKYVELTEVLASSKNDSTTPSVNESHDPSTDQGLFTLRNVPPFETGDLDEIETKLNEFIKANKIGSSVFNRVDRNTYMFNDKKVFMKITHGKLQVGFGSISKTIEEFWKTHKGQERTKTPPQSRLGKKGARSSNHTPEERFNNSFILNKIDNSKIEEFGIESDQQSTPKVNEKEQERSFVNDASKNLREPRTRNENVRQSSSQSKPNEKRLTPNIYKFKEKSHKDLSPILGSHHKQF